MSATLHYDASNREREMFTANSNVTPNKPLISQSDRNTENRGRHLQGLVWVLVSLLLLLYLAASYVYWAKIESVWPIFRA